MWCAGDQENGDEFCLLTQLAYIESAKEDKVEPALDYAIKNDGVINHNSLDMENAKSS